jgi:pilus assembly protein Flp/PilA
MLYIAQIVQKLRNDEKGQALTEYGLIIALIAVALILGLGALSGKLQAVFQSITNAI